MVYYWIGILLLWLIVLCTLACKTDLKAVANRQQQKKKYVADVMSLDALMNAHPHVTNEAALVDALNDESIVYRGCTR